MSIAVYVVTIHTCQQTTTSCVFFASVLACAAPSVLARSAVVGLAGRVHCRVASDLYRVLDKCEVGDVVDVEVLRENAKEHLSVTLEASSN